MRSIAILLLMASSAVAQLPQMEAVTPEVKPAIQEITYDSWFLKTLVMRADNQTCSVRMIFCRYNYAAKKMSPDPADELSVEVGNAYEQAGAYTIWQQAMGAIVACAAKVVQERELTDELAKVDQQIAEAGDSVPDDLRAAKGVIEASLSALRETMGPLPKE